MRESTAHFQDTPTLNEEIDLTIPTIPTRTSQSFTGLQKHCCCCDENIPSAELRRWNQLPIACPSPEGVVTVPLIGGSGHFRMLQVPSKASIPTRENRFRQRRRRDPVQFIGDVRQQIPRSCRPSQVSSQTCKEKLIGSCLVARIINLMYRATNRIKQSRKPNPYVRGCGRPGKSRGSGRSPCNTVKTVTIVQARHCKNTGRTLWSPAYSKACELSYGDYLRAGVATALPGRLSNESVSLCSARIV